MNRTQSKTFKKWNTFFFVLACIAFGAVILSFFSPILIWLVGIVSTIGWGCFIVFGSIITLGLMWIADETKEFNQNWIDFNNRVFASGDSVQQFVFGIIPYISISSLAIFAVAWTFIIIGLVKDKTRKKYYIGHMIALSILSAAVIPLTIVSLVMFYTK